MHEKNVSINMLIYQISSFIHMLLKVRRPTCSGVTGNWSGLHDKLKSHVPRLNYTLDKMQHKW